MLRNSQLTGRGRLASIASLNADTEKDMAGMRQRFARLAGDDAKPRVVSSFNLFQTPKELAVKMAGMLPDGCQTILEPSAGLGRLYRPAKARTWAKFTMVDVSGDCCGELRKIACDDDEVIHGDFLTLPLPIESFDAVIMNPPYHMREDIKHIMHAMALIKPGGTLVGLCMNTHHRDESIKLLCQHWEPLEAGIFEGTKTQAVLFRIAK